MGNVIRQTADVIYEVLSARVLMLNPNEQDWKKISKDFEEKWYMPHCIGAIDGKHMVLQVFEQVA